MLWCGNIISFIEIFVGPESIVNAFSTKPAGRNVVAPGILFKYLYSIAMMRYLCWILARKSPGNCLILTYHRVLPKAAVGPLIEPGMYVTPGVIEKHVRFLKKFFEIIAVEQLVRVQAGREKDHKPYCVLTFDDGWLDFYRYAWPILRKENVPAVVYLPTALIGTEDKFWTDRLGRILETDDGRKILAAKCKDVCTGNIAFRKAYFDKYDVFIDFLKQISYLQIGKILTFCEDCLGIATHPCERTFMNWDEVRELYGSRLISFGSHTVHHAILTTLSDDEVLEELQMSQEKLQSENIKGENISFCYPNGNYNAKIARLVQKSGYASAMTCDAGWNRPGADLFSLKRISLHQDISFTDSLFVYRLNKFR